MKIELHPIAQTTIEEFADLHGLVMEVHERPLPDSDRARYYAHFKRAEVQDGALLSRRLRRWPNA